MIGGYRVGERLQHHGFSGARRRDDQAALSFSNRAKQVEHAARQIFTRRFHFQAALGIERREVIEEYFISRDFGVLEINRLDFDEREIALTVFGRPNLSRDGVAGPQVELPDLRRGNVNVIRAGQIVVFRGAQEAEAIGQAFQDAFGENQAVLLGLGAEDLEDQLLLAHAAGARDCQVLGDFRQIGNIFFFQFRKTNAHRFHFHYSL